LQNPYHNAIHAFDVTQTTYFILKKCQFAELSGLSQNEILSMILAAAIHDFEHPGKNNAFQICSKTYFAIRYNGIV
jgi:3'5'-cyclic nucleotide phosphodiesterase